jgi:glycosyltransferase involved in cell wall biosynthesis
LWNFFGGGAERVAVLLSNALAERSNEVILYSGNMEGPNLEFINPAVKVVQAPGKGPRAYLKGLRKLINEFQPDVVQSHQTTRNVLSIMAHRLCVNRNNRIVVCVEHGEMQHTMVQTANNSVRVFFLVARFVYPLATRIISVSKNVQTSVETFISPFRARHQVLNNPVIFPEMAQRSREAPSHPWLVEKDGKKTIITVGRLEKQKNQDLLIRAFNILKDKVPCRLIIFGEGALLKNLQDLIAELGLSDLVDLPGYTRNPFAALRAADLFVLSSVWEGLPTVAIESLACNTCVVSTDNSTGIREILSTPGTGSVVPLNDSKALARAMETFLLRDKSENDFASAVEKYKIDTVAQEHIRLYGELRGVA